MELDGPPPLALRLLAGAVCIWASLAMHWGGVTPNARALRLCQSRYAGAPTLADTVAIDQHREVFKLGRAPARRTCGEWRLAGNLD
jgi:hypothetical protein